MLAALPGQLLAQGLVTFGGPRDDIAYYVAVDASSNAVVTGNGYVARYAPDGALVSMATFPGGIGTSVAVDASGNAVVAGIFGGTVDFDPGTGVVSRKGAGANDVFVARYAPDGALVNVATFGGPADDYGNGVAVDASGNAVVTGSFWGTADFDPGAGVVSRTSAGGSDAFVARYAPDGALVNVVTFGGKGGELGYRVAFDAVGNAVVTGNFNGTADFDPGAGVVSRTSAGGLFDVFVARYAPDGTLVSVVTFGGMSNDFGYDVKVDASGNAVATGYFNGTTDFDPGAGVVSRTSAGGDEGYVARYAPDGALVSVVTFGGASHDAGRGVALDASGNAVVTGSFRGTADFDPGAGVVSRTSEGEDDAFVARYTPDGALVNVATFGGRGHVLPYGVAVDASGNAVVTGMFKATANFDSGTGFVERSSAGGDDVFVARYAPTGTLVSTSDERPLARTSRLVLLGTRALRVELAEVEPALRLTLYDVLGRHVALLFEGGAEAGSVDARLPSGLTAGVYVVRAEGTRFNETMTVVVR